jgi:hypothetical protein
MNPALAAAALIEWADQLPRKAQAFHALHHQMSQLMVTEAADAWFESASTPTAGPPS